MLTKHQRLQKVTLGTVSSSAVSFAASTPIPGSRQAKREQKAFDKAAGILNQGGGLSYGGYSERDPDLDRVSGWDN